MGTLNDATPGCFLYSLGNICVSSSGPEWVSSATCWTTLILTFYRVTFYHVGQFC